MCSALHKTKLWLIRTKEDMKKLLEDTTSFKELERSVSDMYAFLLRNDRDLEFEPVRKTSMDGTSTIDKLFLYSSKL